MTFSLSSKGCPECWGPAVRMEHVSLELTCAQGHTWHAEASVEVRRKPLGPDHRLKRWERVA